jgi:hypothetical protein
MVSHCGQRHDRRCRGYHQSPRLSGPHAQTGSRQQFGGGLLVDSLGPGIVLLSRSSARSQTALSQHVMRVWVDTAPTHRSTAVLTLWIFLQCNFSVRAGNTKSVQRSQCEQPHRSAVTCLDPCLAGARAHRPGDPSSNCQSVSNCDSIARQRGPPYEQLCTTGR